MLKKLNNKLLLAVFALLLVVVVIVQYASNSKGDRNFREYLAEIDTASVSKIELVKPSEESIVLKKENNKWVVAQGEKQARADKSAVDNIMSSIENLQIKRRVGTKEEQWQKYEVTDSLGTRMKVYGDGDVLADIMVGRFAYKQRGRSFVISTNARIYDEEETFSVEGNLSMSVKRDYNGLRDHTLLNVNPESIQQVSFNYGADSSFVLSRNGEQWLVGGAMADSAGVEKYLGKLKEVRAHNFADMYESAKPGEKSVKVKLTSGEEIVVDAYPDGDKYVMRSSANQGAIFKESESLYKRIFIQNRELVKQ